jgi:hypothetical protein
LFKESNSALFAHAANIALSQLGLGPGIMIFFKLGMLLEAIPCHAQCGEHKKMYFEGLKRLAPYIIAFGP